MNEKPLVTIVTPSFNQAAYLETTIQSVLNQDYPNIEYIIMDGGSTDGSADIIRRYEDRLTYWESVKDKGQTDAINKGFARAHGEILAWLNSDDILYPHAVSEAVEYLTKHPECGLVYGNCDFIDTEGNIIGRFNAKQTDHRKLTQGYVHIPQQACFWHADLWKKVGPLDDTIYFAMDYDLWLRLAEISEVKYLPETKPWAAFRLHADAKTIAEDDRCWPDMLRIHKRNGGSVFSVIYAKYCLRKLLGPVIRRRRRKIVFGNRTGASPASVEKDQAVANTLPSASVENKNSGTEKPGEGKTGSQKRAGSLYRQRLHDLDSINWNTFASLKRIDPEPSWEICEVGLDIRNGYPYKMNSRQRSYGIVLSSEDEFERIDYSELSQLTGKEINENNWEKFIPEKKKEEFMKLSEPDPPKKISRNDCIYDGKMTLNAYCVKTVRRYGADIVWFRKCRGEYRVFYYANARAGDTYLPMDMPPTEEQIERIFSHNPFGNAYERVLSADEVSWFFKQYFTKEENDAELWNDIYGGTYTYTFTDGPIRSESEGGNTRFTSRMQRALSDLAQKGLEVID